MTSNVDGMLSRYKAEIEGKQAFVEQLLEKAQKEGRDLNAHELELSKRARDEISALHEQLDPMLETQRIAQDSATRLAAISGLETREAPQKQVEYRSAGAYILDRWRAGLGHEDAVNRIEMFHRAAAHQTTADSPGLLPEPILGPVVNFIDASRPLVNWLGPRQLPSGSWSRPKVTQHTSTGAQTAEKTELVSQKMTIAKIPVSAGTYGGYVNVSRQSVDWTQPAIMDIIIGDLAGQYAIDTELDACGEMLAAAGTQATLPTGALDPDALAGALWGAAAAIISATAGQGNIAAFTTPALIGQIGPLFPPVNPQDAQSTGMTTASLGTGLAGNIAGIPIYVSNGVAANQILVLSSAAGECYEDRLGSLQVVEPSVLGIQVAYAGYFASLVLEANGMKKIIKTP
jgi:HK97 family phage major capsid protein